MYQVQPSDANRFSLRLLLLHRPGPISFEDLRTVDGETFPTFKQAAMHLGLLEYDEEWRNRLEEASLLQMPAQMRELFATILIFNSPTDERALFEEFAQQMSEDFLHRERALRNDPILRHAQRHSYQCSLSMVLLHIQNFRSPFHCTQNLPATLEDPHNEPKLSLPLPSSFGTKLQ